MTYRGDALRGRVETGGGPSEFDRKPGCLGALVDLADRAMLILIGLMIFGLVAWIAWYAAT